MASAVPKSVAKEASLSSWSFCGQLHMIQQTERGGFLLDEYSSLNFQDGFSADRKAQESFGSWHVCFSKICWDVFHSRKEVDPSTCVGFKKLSD